MQDVVIGGKYHQHEHQAQSDPEPHLPRSVVTSPTEVLRVMPSTPTRCAFPNGSFISLSSGVPRNCSVESPRLTVNVNCSPARMPTTRCISEKLPIALPLIVVMTSPT